MTWGRFLWDSRDDRKNEVVSKVYFSWGIINVLLFSVDDFCSVSSIFFIICLFACQNKKVENSLVYCLGTFDIKYCLTCKQKCRWVVVCSFFWRNVYSCAMYVFCSTGLFSSILMKSFLFICPLILVTWVRIVVKCRFREETCFCMYNF